MKKILFFSTCIVLLIVGLIVNSRKVTRRDLPKPAPATLGTSEDPLARIRYEKMRLVDTKTGQIPKDIRRRELNYARTLPSKIDVFPSGTDNHLRNLSWNQRGPVNLGGRTRAIGIDVNNENIIVAGGVSGGVWRSTDGGNNWVHTTMPQQLHNITCLAQDTRSGHSNTWYYGTGEFVGNSASGQSGAFFTGDGLFKSTDNGMTWTQLPSTLSGTPHVFDSFFDYVWNIKTDPSDLVNDNVYIATFGAILKSSDAGASWNAVLGGESPYSPFTDLAISSNGILYATMSKGGADEGVWRSTDGVNWTNITPANWPANYKRIVLSIAPSDENVIYFLGDTPGYGLNDHSMWKYTYISGDGNGAGGSWSNLSNNLPAFGGLNGDFDSQNSYNLMISVKPDDKDVVFIGGKSLYRSTNGFASNLNTTRIGGYANISSYAMYTNHHCDVHTNVFLPSDPTVMFSGHDGGLSKTTNNLAQPVTWSSLNSGYITTQFYTVAVDHGNINDQDIIGGMQDNGSWQTDTNDFSEEWFEMGAGGDGGHCAITDNGRSVYTSSQYAYILREAYDAGGAYLGWARIDPAGASDYLFINPFVLDPNDPKLMYLPAGSTLWRNSDVTAIPGFSNNKASVNWIELTNATVPNDTISAIGISTLPANRLYLGTINGKVFRCDDANEGNPGLTDIWTAKGLPSGAFVSCIAVHPFSGDKALLVFSNYQVKSLFYTEDAGGTWNDVSGNLEEFPNGSGDGPSVRWAEILPATGETVYFVGTSTGLYSTTNLNGSSTIWTLEGSANIGNVVVDMVDTRVDDGLVVVATHGKGVFSGHIANPIPVEMSSFVLNLLEHGIELQWQTKTETNNYGFQVERRLLNGTWETIGFVSGNGTTTDPQFYRFIDENLLAGEYEYRLKQIDVDGSYQYTDPIDTHISTPAKFRLYQNYPNPFNPLTRIKYSIPKDARVTITVYDQLGRTIEVLTDSYKKAGSHSILFDAKDYPNGVLFYTMTSDDFTTTKKMTVLK